MQKLWRSRFGLGWFLVAFGLCHALAWGVLRWRYEKRSGAVAIAVDFDDVRALSDASRLPRLKMLRLLRASGATHVGLSEQNLVLLRAAGRLTLSPRDSALRLFPRSASLRAAFNEGGVPVGEPHAGLLLWSADQALMRAIEPLVREQSPREFEPRVVDLPPASASSGASSRSSSGTMRGLVIANSAQLLNDASMGFDPAQVEAVRQARLRPIALMVNRLNLNAARLASRLGQARATGARLVLFDDTEALGYSSLLPLVADEMRARGLGFGAWEFSDQRGLAELSEATGGALARAHIVSPREASSMAPEVLADRYARAARERNVRLLYVRLLRHYSRFKDASASGASAAAAPRADDLPAQNATFLRAIRDGLGQAPAWAQGPALRSLGLGLRAGEPAVFGDFPLSTLRSRLGSRAPIVLWAGLFGCGLGVLGAALLAANLLLDLSPRARAVLFVAGAASVALLACCGPNGARLLAFGAACAFPIVALAWSGLVSIVQSSVPVQSTASGATSTCGDAPGGLARQCACCVLRMLGVALAGGLIVAGLLCDWRFASKTLDFWGTKPAQIIPLALGAFLVAGRFEPHAVERGGAGQAQERARRGWAGFLEGRFTLRSALGALALALALYLWIARSGNDAGVTVSPLEWKLRAMLEHALVARPRNKELFAAYPALVLAIWCARRGWHRVALAGCVVALIAPIDVLNSFAQANNPLALALWRSLGGALLGTILGLALVLVAGSVVAPRELASRARSARRQARQVLVAPRVRLGAVALVLLAIAGISLRRWRVAQRYQELSAPSEQAWWPWAGARREELSRGVSHWKASSADGTSLELLQFDFSRDPGLRLGLYDQDEDDARPFDNRAAYWKRGLAPIAAHLNRRSKNNLVAVFNGSFFGLLNERPRDLDRAFHLSPLVLNRRVHYVGANHRWTLGLERASPGHKYLSAQQPESPALRLLHLPSASDLGGFEWAVGSAQCVLKDGQALQIKPYPREGEAPLRPPVPSTPAQAGHIPTLDFMKTSRVSLGWSHDKSKMWLLFVKEPDGEDASRAQVLGSRPSSGGWRLDDVSRFWQSMRAQQGAWNALVLDGGDVAQLAFRRADSRFELVPPRFSTPRGPATARYTSAPDGHDAPPSAQQGGALTYLYLWRQPNATSNP